MNILELEEKERAARDAQRVIAEFEAEIKVLMAPVEELRVKIKTLEVVERDYRDAAAEFIERGGDPNALPLGTKMRRRKKWQYDKSEALAWAFAYKPSAVKVELRVREFETVLKSGESIPDEIQAREVETVEIVMEKSND